MTPPDWWMAQHARTVAESPFRPFSPRVLSRAPQYVPCACGQHMKRATSKACQHCSARGNGSADARGRQHG